MGLSDMAMGVNNALKQQMLQRLQAEAVQRQIAQQQFANQMAEKQFASNEELKRANLAELASTHKAAESDRQMGIANTLADQIPAGAALQESDPAVKMLQQGGRGSLLTMQGMKAEAPPSSLLAMGDSGQPQEVAGTMPNSPMPNGPRLYTKGASAKQQDTTADNARQIRQMQGTLDAKAASLEQAKQSLEARIAQQGESFALRKQIADLDTQIKEQKLQATQSTADAQKEHAAATRSEVVRLVEELKKDPAMSSAVGVKGVGSLFGLTNTPIAGTPSAGYVSKVERLKSLLTLDNIKQMRGMGALSDKEGQMLARAATSLDRNAGEDAFMAELNRLQFDAGGTPSVGAGGTVSMTAPDGRALSVPADKVAEMEAHGAKRR